jgi:nitrate/TMAO reductase-like tetraheme cytochrome c subunit
MHLIKLMSLSAGLLLALQVSPAAQAAESLMQVPAAITVTFPKGTATPSEVCGECHKAIYREYAFGFGGDNRAHDSAAVISGKQGNTHPTNVSSVASAHAMAGTDAFPLHARDNEVEGKSCNVCHFPEAFNLPDLNVSEIFKPKPRAKEAEMVGLSCASCHLTPEGKIRGPYSLRAPHANSPEASIKTSVMCAYCHSLGKRVVGKQTQTFLEWRDDFWKQGLGNQNCQDCHMPRTVRKLAEDYKVPERVASRHLWTGGRSLQHLQNALNLVTVQPAKGAAKFEFHVINIGAGHSVPTGSNRRAVYLQVDVLNSDGKAVTSTSWMFAPSYGARPDDKSFLEEDKKLTDAKAAMQADAQGPHEAIIRAGEERVLTWSPELKPGSYTVKSHLVYDLNRYNDRAATGDQTLFKTVTLEVSVNK